ncbi:MAG: hypothetical protein L0215_04410 [Gemmataceae bacterium]|nr:hypothetical protein [Gemmataceae bacterium]
MNRRFLARVGLLAVLAIGGFLLVIWWTAPKLVSMKNFERIKAGMTEAEVVEILGTAGAVGTRLGKEKVADAVAIQFGDAPPSKQLREWLTTDGRAIAVGFDSTGKVCMAANFRVTEGWLDKLRRWLRLS